MTYLLLQTFLLLLATYFLGALVACLIKRTLYSQSDTVAIPVGAPATAGVALAPHETVKPRSFDPVQPRIDILPRPEPRAAPAHPETSRFDLALTGKEPPTPVQAKPAFSENAQPTDPLSVVLAANAGLPRRSMVEIRPAVLKPVTPAPVKSEEKRTEPKPAPAPVAAPPDQETKRSEPQTHHSASATAAAAAAAAVAAAKAAVANSAARLGPVAEEDRRPVAKQVDSKPQSGVSTSSDKPAQSAAPETISTPAASVGASGDDFLRIRAIDEDTDRRLKALGITRFEQIALWTPADVNRINQTLGFTDRIDREQWIEQAQILAKGGDTYYSRNRAASRPASQPSKPSGTAPEAPRTEPTAAKNDEPLVVPPKPMTPSQAVQAAMAAAAAAASVPRMQSSPQSTAVVSNEPASAVSPAPRAPEPEQATASVKIERSVSELAAAAAAAIAAASASVTRGMRPIEPISPLSKVDPNVVMPAKLSDAIKEKEAKSSASAPVSADPGAETTHLRSVKSEALRAPTADVNDLKRIRGIGVLIEKRLNSLGISSYEQIANWTSAEIDRISQQLDFKGRIERENWVEQARILASGGQTEFSRRVDRGDVETSKE